MPIIWHSWKSWMIGFWVSNQHVSISLDFIVSHEFQLHQELLRVAEVDLESREHQGGSLALGGYTVARWKWELHELVGMSWWAKSQCFSWQLSWGRWLRGVLFAYELSMASIESHQSRIVQLQGAFRQGPSADWFKTWRLAVVWSLLQILKIYWNHYWNMVNGLLASPITCFVEACLDCFESSCGHTGFDWILQLALVYIYLFISFFGARRWPIYGPHLANHSARFPLFQRSQIESLASQEEQSSRLRSRKDTEVPFDVDSNAPWMPIGYNPSPRMQPANEGWDLIGIPEPKKVTVTEQGDNRRHIDFSV